MIVKERTLPSGERLVVLRVRLPKRRRFRWTVMETGPLEPTVIRCQNRAEAFRRYEKRLRHHGLLDNT
jgi:hypothetical protein